GTILGGSGAIIRGTLNAQNLNLHQANILNANIQDATITGTLSGVDGTFVGDLVGATIYSSGTSFVGSDLYITDNLYLGNQGVWTGKGIYWNNGNYIQYGTTGFFIIGEKIFLDSLLPISVEGDLDIKGSQLEALSANAKFRQVYSSTGSYGYFKFDDSNYLRIGNGEARLYLNGQEV